MDLPEHRQIIERNIERGQCLCVKVDGELAGALLFSLTRSELCFMAVHPDHRGIGIGSALVGKIINLFPPDAVITVSTFREGDPNGWDIAPRVLYKKMGFVEGELAVGYGGYPVQKYVLRK
jgi:GNAT superfamily N-acetyltransferase